jgi:hypothetical protein
MLLTHRPTYITAMRCQISLGKAHIHTPVLHSMQMCCNVRHDCTWRLVDRNKLNQTLPSRHTVHDRRLQCSCQSGATIFVEPS